MIILLMAEIPRPTTVWMVLKPQKEWDKLPTSTGERRISAINSISATTWIKLLKLGGKK